MSAQFFLFAETAFQGYLNNPPESHAELRLTPQSGYFVVIYRSDLVDEPVYIGLGISNTVREAYLEVVRQWN